MRPHVRLHISSTCHHMSTPCLNPRGALVTPSHRRSRARHLAYRSTALMSRSRSIGARATAGHLFVFPSTHSHSPVVTRKCSLVRVSRRRRPGLTDHSSHTDVLTQSFHCDLLLQSTDSMVLWEHQHVTQILAGRSQESSMSVHATMNRPHGRHAILGLRRVNITENFWKTGVIVKD